MKKQTTQPVEKRKPGPKFARSVLPENFQIRRSPSPMAAILDEAERGAPPDSLDIVDFAKIIQSPVEPEPMPPAQPEPPAQPAPEPLVQRLPLAQPVPEPLVQPALEPPVQPAPEPSAPLKLPTLTVLVDEILPHFPPAQQAILLRLHRWSKGYGQAITVSAPRLAASINLDEKSVRMHLQKLMNQGVIVRGRDGEFTARFGGTDRATRGLILRLDAAALIKLCA